MYTIQFNLMWNFIYWLSVFFLFSMKTFFSLWMMIELNVVIFLSLVNNSIYWLTSSVAMKYFLVQGLSSLLLLLSILLSMQELSWKFWNFLFFVSVILKLGIFPFYSWFVNIAKQVNRDIFFLLCSIQKLSGFLVLSLSGFSIFLILSIFFSSLISFISSLGQNNILTLLSFSSIFNTAWFTVLMKFLNLFVYIFFVYSISFYLVLSFQEKFYKMSFNESLFSDSNVMNKFIFIFSFINMGGLPPMLGFLVKLLFISFLVEEAGVTLGIFYVIMSTFFLFIYLSVSSYMFLLNSAKKSLIYSLKVTNLVKIFLLFSPLVYAW